MEKGLNTAGFFLFEIEDDFGFGIVDDAFAILSIFKGEKVVDVLGGTDCAAAVSSDDFENLQNELSGQTVAVCSDQLPALVYEDGLFLCAVFFGLVPYKVKGYKHTDSQQITCQL